MSYNTVKPMFSSICDDQFKQQELHRHANFQSFCESWFAKMDANLLEFRTAYRKYEDENICQSFWTGGLAPRTPTMERFEDRMRMHYYRCINSVYTFDPDMIPPQVASGLDGSLTWAGAWSPSRALSVCCSKLAVCAQLKARLESIAVKVLAMSRLDSLLESQQRRLHALKIETAREEDTITEYLLHEPAGERLLRVREVADELRMKTLRKLDDILTFDQLADFLSSAWEMKFGIQEWMKIWDAN